jgi:outer membrane protein insertion porin family
VNPHAENDPAQLGPCGICQIGRFSTSFVNDHRNDPVNPSTGTFNTTTFQVATKIFGSELNFTTLYHQLAFYFPVRGGVLANSVRFGWAHPFGRTANFATLWNPQEMQFVTQTQQLPATERYWAGGSTTLRGFSLDDARPSSDLTLEGGNVMTVANVEYRVPLRMLPIKNVGGAVFYDAGNVFQQISTYQFKEYSHTVGFGLRYLTPVGPARLDFGFNLFPEKQPDGTPSPILKVFFTLGNAF